MCGCLKASERVIKPYHEMTAAERLAARIAKNRDLEQRTKRQPPERRSLDEIVAQLNSRHRRASYGAVAGIVGGVARGLMNGRTKCHEYSWVVASSGPGRGWPTDYRENEVHPDCLRQIRSAPDNIIEDAESLRIWLQQA
jgi:hypothetical protein